MRISKPLLRLSSRSFAPPNEASLAQLAASLIGVSTFCVVRVLSLVRQERLA